MNGDFEGGFSDSPEGVAANVALAVETGIAGLSLEDRSGDGLYEPSRAAERIAAAREAIDHLDRQEMLVGRTDLDETIARLVAYAQAGADGLYASGVAKADQRAAALARDASVGPRRTGRAARENRQPSCLCCPAGFEAAASLLGEEGALPPGCFAPR